MRVVPRSFRHGRRILASAGLAAGSLLAASLIGAPAASSAPGPSDTPSEQRSARATAVTSVADSLGAEAAGVYRDAATGQMVVNISDLQAADAVRAAGAQPRLVENSAAELAQATSALERSLTLPGTAWATDPATNQVVVTADDTVTDAELATVRSVVDTFGAAVTVERVPGELSTTISGGEAIWGASGGRCSLGFNVRSGGTYYLLTAGHCTNPISSWYTTSNAYIGPTVGSSFPGNDFGIVRHDGGQPAPGNVYLYGGTQDITGAGNAYVGEYVVRSGSTTGVHDGYVQALNATVNYAEGQVRGLIQTNVCAEGGDSGGSLFDGSTAIGLTSGGNGNCTLGGTTYFQPVTEALSYFGVSVY